MRATLDRIAKRLGEESGTLYGHGRRAVALVYPSPYSVAMSSLGFQAVYGGLNRLPDTVAERAFLPDDDDPEPRVPLLTYEGGRPAGDYPVLAFSVAYELELLGVLTCLRRMGVPVLASERGPRHPWVLMGGPLTFSNPLPLAPFADVIAMGEGEDLLAPAVDALFSGGSRSEVLAALADEPGFFVPAHHGDSLPPIHRSDDQNLPARSTITTPNTALSRMFLVEPERGCSRGCTFCVMRRGTHGGMRTVPVQRVLDAISPRAERVGLVGAAVTDHPRIVDIVRAVVDGGREVGLSSLRADRLTPEFVELLMRGGYRTLTVASDGASERLRIAMLKKIRAKHLLRAAELASNAGIPLLKVYMMLGAPDETDADVDELIAFTQEQAALAAPKTRVALGIAPFVAKRNTPLDGLPFAGISVVDARVDRIRRALAPRVEVRPTSSRWAWVEYMLAQGGVAAGLATLDAWRVGGRFSAFKRAFAAHRVRVPG